MRLRNEKRPGLQVKHYLNLLQISLETKSKNSSTSTLLNRKNNSTKWNRLELRRNLQKEKLKSGLY